MKNKILFLLLFLGGISFAQSNYPLVTIHDIQFVPDSIISQGDIPSPLNGDTVRVRGVVMTSPLVDPVNDRRPIIAAGARWVTYIQDTSGTLWGGLNILQDDTSEAYQSTFFDLIDTTDIVEFTGVVTEYFTSTELLQLINPITPINIVGSIAKRPEPIELTISDFMDGSLKLEAEKYENMYVIIRNVISSDRNSSSGTFRINDASGNYMVMYDQSGYFTNRTHRLAGLTDYDAPQDGTPINFIRGIINTRTDAYYIVPLYPGDINITATPPVISSVRRDAAEVAPNQTVEISANIIDLDGSVESASLIYSINDGPANEISMHQSISDTASFTAAIPGQIDSAVVSYYIKSTDNNGLVSYNPSDTVNGKYFYLVLNNSVTIKDVQYSPFGSGNGGYINYHVSLTGVVSADTSDIPGFGSTALRVYMQDGSSPWSGIQIGTAGTLGADVLKLKDGDNVTINGLIREDFNVTKIDSITQITVNSSGNALPVPVLLTTGDIGKKTGGTISAEQWESVLIKYQNVNVSDDNADGESGIVNNFGEIFISDGSGDTRVELQDGNHHYHNSWEAGLDSAAGNIQVKEGSQFTSLTGVLYYSFSNYKLVPRTDDDFEGFVVDVKDSKNYLPSAFKLDQNYPNPFNPSTTISYSIPKEGIVTLKIYNILGQEVKTLINKFQSAGNYKIIFDAGNLTSGVYFYSINTGSNTEVKKMMLLK